MVKDYEEAYADYVDEMVRQTLAPSSDGYFSIALDSLQEYIRILWASAAIWIVSLLVICWCCICFGSFALYRVCRAMNCPANCMQYICSCCCACCHFDWLCPCLSLRSLSNKFDQMSTAGAWNYMGELHEYEPTDEEIERIEHLRDLLEKTQQELHYSNV